MFTKNIGLQICLRIGGNVTWLMYVAAAAKSLQSCPTLCDPMDCSLPGSSVHGTFQARTLERVAISSSMYVAITSKRF